MKLPPSGFEDWAKKNEIDNISLMWIDVQGAEKNVIEGLGDIKIDYIWMEYGEKAYEDALSRNETISYMNTKGFNIIDSQSDKTETGDLLFKRK